MSQEPRMWLPDTHARYQKRAILASKVEILTQQDEDVELAIRDIARKGKEIIDYVLPGKQSTEKKKKKSTSKNKGNECHDPRTGRFCKGTKGTGFKKSKMTPNVVVVDPETKKEEILLIKATYEIIASDGTKLFLKDMEGLATPAQAKAWLEALAMNHAMDPRKPPVEIILLPEYEKGTYGFVYKAETLSNKIFLNFKEVGDDHNKKFPESIQNQFMDVAHSDDDHPNPVNKALYIVTHEYGHAYDFSKNRNSAKALYDAMEAEGNKAWVKGLDAWRKTAWSDMSDYGEQSAIEAYAETYTEWMLTKGTTTNKAAQAYAKFEKWPGFENIKPSTPPVKRASVKSGRARPVLSGEKVEMAEHPEVFASKETEGPKFPLKGPVVKDDFDSGKATAVGIKLRESTPAEIVAAKKILAEIAKEASE